MSHFVFEKDFSRHPMHYFTLLCVEMIGLWGIFWFSFQPIVQMGIIISMSVTYVVWGLVHHYQHRDLRLTIIFEYSLMAILAVLIFGSLLLRA